MPKETNGRNGRIFFPDLYTWVREAPNDNLASSEKGKGGLPLPLPQRAPVPAKLGLELWVNAYRSGDYAGRSVWLNEWYGLTEDDKARKFTDEKDGEYCVKRVEFCVGSGAHTHYWDDAAPDVDSELNNLLEKTTSLCKGPNTAPASPANR